MWGVGYGLWRVICVGGMWCVMVCVCGVVVGGVSCGGWYMVLWGVVGCGGWDVVCVVCVVMCGVHGVVGGMWCCGGCGVL